LTSCYFLLDGDSDNSIEKRAKRRTFEKLILPKHRFRVGDLGAIDSTEATVDDVARHFPFELLVAPAFEVLQHEQAQNNFRRRAVPPASTALGKAIPLRSDDLIDQRLIVQQFIHATEDRVHQLFGAGDHAEHHELRESHLPLTSTNHAPMCRGAEREFNAKRAFGNDFARHRSSLDADRLT
jgi:hypothetical protein